MHSKRALRASLLSFLLVLGSFTAFTVPTVGAEESEGETTYYFHSLFEGGFDQNRPTKENISAWPATLQTSKDIQLEWLSTLMMYILAKMEESGYNESDPYMGEMDELMDMFHPFKLTGMLFPEDEDTLHIKGDVVFDVYIKSPLASFRLLQNKRDKIKVSIKTLNFSAFNFDGGNEDPYNFSMPFDEINKTITIQRRFIKPIQKYQIKLEDVDLKLNIFNPMLFCSIEIIPGDKPIGWLASEKEILSRFLSIFPRHEIRETRRDERLNTTIEKMKENEKEGIQILGEIIDMLKDFPKNGTSYILNGCRSSSILFDSVTYPTSVSLPFKSESEQDKKTYYLYDDNVMNEQQPSNTSELQVKLSSEKINWTAPPLERNKILKNANVDLYLNSRFLLPKASVVVTLYNGDKAITSVSKKLSGDILLFKPDEPITFSFEDINEEIFYDNSLSIGVSIENGSFFNAIRKVNLLYGSEEYSSSVSVTYEETDNIQFELTSDPEDALIIPNDEVKYTLNIQSLYDDEIDLDISEKKIGDWSYSIVETLPISISAGETEEINVIVKSENNKKEAYGDEIDLTF